MTLLFAPLVLVASELAHMLAYQLTYSDARDRRSVLEATDHGYLGHWPAGLAALLTVVVVALALRTADARRNAAVGVGARASWFIVLPPLVFVVQEHLERLAAYGSVQWGASLAPVFLIGLALQFPFGLVAYFLARFALRAAERLGNALAATGARVRRRQLVRRLVPRVVAVRPPDFVQLQDSRAPPCAAF